MELGKDRGEVEQMKALIQLRARRQLCVCVWGAYRGKSFTYFSKCFLSLYASQALLRPGVSIEGWASGERVRVWARGERSFS